MFKAFETLQNNIEVDTDIAVAQIELLERSNMATTQKYQSICDQLEPTALAANELSAAKQGFEDMLKSLDEAEEYANYLDTVLGELEQWVSELDVKSRRLRQR